MNMLRRAERGLEGLVSGVFARAFKSDVQPVEIAAALQRELDQSGRVLSRDRRLVPNVLLVDLSAHDYGKLAPYRGTLTDDLAATASEYAAGQGYVFPGRVRVRLRRDDDLATGRFTVTSEVSGGQAAAGGGAEPDYQARYHSEPAADLAPGPDHDAPNHQAPDEGGPDDGAGDYRAAGYRQPPGSFVPGFDAGDGADGAGTRLLDAVSPQLPPRRAEARTPLAELHVHGGERVPVELPGAVIGRSTEADVRVDDPGASRQHAEIRIVWDGRRYEFWLVDLHSTNGTVVDGQRVPEARLQNGSRITVGATTLLLRIDESRLATG